MKHWLWTLALLGAVWLVAALIIHMINAAQPTAESVTRYADGLQLSRMGGEERQRAIARMENMVNHITFEERQRLDRAGTMHRFVSQLSPAEQDAYLDATLPTGFQQLMDSFNKMDPAKRKKMVADAMARLKEHEGDGPPVRDERVVQHVVDQGLKSFYRDANADVKLDLAPLIEQMQRNLQH